MSWHSARRASGQALEGEGSGGGGGGTVTTGGRQGCPLTRCPHVQAWHTPIRASGTALRGETRPLHVGDPTLRVGQGPPGWGPSLRQAQTHWGLLPDGMTEAALHTNLGPWPPLAASGTQGPTGVTSRGKPPESSSPEAPLQVGAQGFVPSRPSVTQGPHLPLIRPRESRADGPRRSCGDSRPGSGSPQAAR